MQLSLLDISVIVAYLIIIIGVGLFFRKKANKDINSFFLAGRNIPWWIAGASMIASGFAADTPLAVSEMVTTNGISGNWLWWNMLAGGMLTTFFFSRLWRKSNVLTDLELIEIRYSGKVASFLRGFKAIYLGLFMNAIIIGWVNVALLTILEVFFGIKHQDSIWYIIAAMAFTAIYSGIAGFIGVAVTDFLEFLLGIGGTTVLAFIVLNDDSIGGIEGLKQKVPEWSLDFFPKFSESSFSSVSGSFSLTIGTFLAYITTQWWSSWYPGSDPGGGGAVAQRMLSTKNEQHAIAATLFYQIFHYCLRPWPWIIVGLSVFVLFPDLEQKRQGYVMIMRDFLPTGLKGLLLVAFFSSYISTISSQFNWGTSYIVNDIYKRFIKPKATQPELLRVSRLCIIAMMLFALLPTLFITSISDVWKFVIECGAGLGLVLILRWYWWRINGWSELVATIVPFIVYAITHFVFDLKFPDSFFITVLVTTVSWIIATYVTDPVDKNVLQNFYSRIKPPGAWKPIRESLGLEKNKEINTRSLLICWLSSVAMAYGILFFIGYVLFRQWNNAFVMLSVISGSFVILAYQSRKNRIFHDSDS